MDTQQERAGQEQDSLLNPRTLRGASLTVALAVFATIAAVSGIERLGQQSDDLHRWVSLIQHTFVTLLVVFIFHSIEKFQSQQSTATVLADVQNEFKSQLRTVIPFGVAAKELGLVGLYSSREHAMADVRERIDRADKKIRMLGVAFKEQLQLGGISVPLRKFSSHHPNDESLQILVLHPMTSPAVFRAFLESPLKQVAEILQHHAPGAAAPRTPGTYFDTQLFTDCNLTRIDLEGHELESRVRYYRRDATLWMIIIDDEVFVESYTFGRRDDQMHLEGKAAPALRLGGHMPVFRFRGSEFEPYKILNDHFSRLWSTSTDTLADLTEQLRSREDYVNSHVFYPRVEWLQKVAAALEALDAKKKP